MNNTIKHREVEQYEHHFIDHVDNNPLDRICQEIELGMTPSRWSVLGKVEMIKARMMEKGTWKPCYQNMLDLLSESAKESL